MALEYETTEDVANNSEPEKVGYKHPPKKHRFRKGVSGNRKGRPKKNKGSLPERFAAALEGEIPVPGKKRARVTRLHALIRNLLERAAEGDVKALTTMVWLSEAKEGKALPTTPNWAVMSFQEVMLYGTTTIMDEAFFREQDELIRELKKQAKTGGSIKGMLEKELKRKVAVEDKAGNVKKLPIGDVIVARSIAAAKSDPAVFKLLVRLIPEKKIKRGLDRPQILRPTRQDYQEMGDQMPSWAPAPVD